MPLSWALMASKLIASHHDPPVAPPLPPSPSSALLMGKFERCNPRLKTPCSIFPPTLPIVLTFHPPPPASASKTSTYAPTSSMSTGKFLSISTPLTHRILKNLDASLPTTALFGRLQSRVPKSFSCPKNKAPPTTLPPSAPPLPLLSHAAPTKLLSSPISSPTPQLRISSEPTPQSKRFLAPVWLHAILTRVQMPSLSPTQTDTRFFNFCLLISLFRTSTANLSSPVSPKTLQKPLLASFPLAPIPPPTSLKKSAACTRFMLTSCLMPPSPATILTARANAQLSRPASSSPPSPFPTKETLRPKRFSRASSSSAPQSFMTPTILRMASHRGKALPLSRLPAPLSPTKCSKALFRRLLISFKSITPPLIPSPLSLMRRAVQVTTAVATSVLQPLQACAEEHAERT
mmetsp:Transcript_8436/g.17063  ORF Transcript_8436/g.17063 Transcript_8436/m.17063 type:complete len:404 (-) Transcript_8436:2060-3271(-)